MEKDKVEIDIRRIKGERVYVNRGGRSYKAIVIDDPDGLIIGSPDDDDNTLVMTSPYNRKTKKK